MAFQSVWYFSNLPEDVVDIIERDLTENYDPQMADSRLHGDALNKEKRNSQNAWIPTTHWVGGFLWHYIERANRENFLYDLRCIDGESMQYTRYGEGQFYGWHNDAGLATQYNYLTPMIMRVVTCNFLMRQETLTLLPVSVVRSFYLTLAHNTEF
jgi:PKHD-type hydroxylase